MLIVVELDVENLPVSHADTGMPALVVLVAVVAADVLQSAVVRDSDLIDEADAQA
jgi:hypothetical protein